MKTTTKTLLTAAAVLLPSVAGAAETFTPPARDSSYPIWCLVCLVVGAGGAAAIAFKNSRRTHLE